LESVDWSAGNYVTVDYDTTPEYYTAVATYNATGTSTKVTGYMTTAEYTGTLAKLARGKTVYTAYFEGEEIRTPLELIAPEAQPESSEPSGKPAEQIVAETSAEPAESASERTRESADAPALKGGVPRSASYIVISLLALMLSGAIYFIIRKGPFNNEKTHNHTADARDGGGGSSDGDSGSRG
jgi:cobalamin biosynthesis Mg chelatase CobN